MFFLHNGFNKILYEHQQGFALISVIIITVLMLIMLLSLLIISSHSLYLARCNISKNSIISVADSAITEVILKLNDNIHWGEHNEQLFMRSGFQDFTYGGLDPVNLPLPNSKFTFEDIGCYYYVSFNKNDSVFKKKDKYYSVNNLSSSSGGTNWHGKYIPPNTADIVIIAGKDDKVRHVEFLIAMVQNKDGTINFRRLCWYEF